MDPKIQNFTQNKTKTFENVIVQQIGSNREIPILPKPPLLDEPKVLARTATILNVNENRSTGIIHNSSQELQSQSHSMISFEKNNAMSISNEMTKTPSLGSQTFVAKTSSLVINSTGCNNNQNLIKILPKVPVKSIQRSSTGNILLQGPNNKILSLQIKQPNLVPAVVSTPITTPVVGGSTNASNPINLNKNMQILQNKITTSGTTMGKQTSTILSTPTVTSKSIQIASVQVPISQTSVTPYLTGAKVTSQTIINPAVPTISSKIDLTCSVSAATQSAVQNSKLNPSITTTSVRIQPHLGSHSVVSQIKLPENVILKSNSNQQKQFSNLSQNKNILNSSQCKKTQSISTVNHGSLIQSETFTNTPILISNPSSSAAQTLSSGETVLSLNSCPMNKSRKKILLPMGKISSNVTISKASLNARLGPIEEPSPSISLIEKRNVLTNLPLITTSQTENYQNTFPSKKNAFNNTGISSNSSDILSFVNRDVNLKTLTKMNKSSEIKPYQNLTPNNNRNEENITIITQFIPEQKSAILLNKVETDITSKTLGVIVSQSSNDLNTKSDTTDSVISTVAINIPLNEPILSKVETNLMTPKSIEEAFTGFTRTQKTKTEVSSLNDVKSNQVNNFVSKSLNDETENKIKKDENVIETLTLQAMKENSTENADIIVENEKQKNEFNATFTDNEEIGIQCQKTPQKQIKILANSGKMKPIKQQSLLKNKNVEILKRSPRTSGRSKSLTYHVPLKKPSDRRLSASSDNQTKNYDSSKILKDNLVNKSVEILEILGNMAITKGSQTPNSSTEKLNQTLLCEEKIEISPNISSESNNSGNNHLSEAKRKNNETNKITKDLKKDMPEKSSLSHNSVVVDEKQNQEKTPKIIEPETNTDISSLNRDSPILIEHIISNIKPNTPAQNAFQINELANILKWRTGIGLTKDAAIAFRINELGLLEIFEKNVNRNRLDIAYEKPIYKRNKQSFKPEEYAEPIYFCKGCNCHGAAVDFLAPEYCSLNCITICEKKKSGKSSNLQQIYINQQKQKKLRKQKMSGLLDDSSISLLSINVNSKRDFCWTSYLNASDAQPAPIDLFLNPFPCGPNLFQVGMKLEAIDPEYSFLFCVCSVVEIKGYRLKIHFDGYSNTYDFWINADSMDIFPPGWCAKTSRILQPPKHMSPASFNWSNYLTKTKTIPASRNLFTHLNSSSNTNPFKVGVRFEADDLRNTRKVCVASVADVLDNRILVHFDGWDDRYDYWVDCNSPYIHPVNWHLQNNFDIVPPPDWKDIFDWHSYLCSINGTPATEDYFQTRDPILFKVGMKLEIVDKKNPSLIRPGTVIMTDGYEIKVLFDGWPSDYAFWVVDDSPDIHPIGWCDATGHELESPPGFENLPSIMPCSVEGCRGIGNSKRFDIDFHATEESCPYLLINWIKELEKPERVKYSEINMKEHSGGQKRKHNDSYNWETPTKYKKNENYIDNSNFVINNPTTFSSTSIENKQIKLRHSGQSQLNLIDNLSQLKLEDSQNDNLVDNAIADSKLQITKQLLCDYGPRLEQSYKIWLSYAQQITETLEEIRKNPLEWKVDEVVTFINTIPQCKDISELFCKEDIDGEALLSLRQKDLTDILKIKLGTAIKIYHLIILLRAEVITRFS